MGMPAAAKPRSLLSAERLSTYIVGIHGSIDEDGG